MPAYFVANVAEFTDLEKFKEYGANAGTTITAAGGKAIAAATPEDLEGDAGLERLVIVEFPDMETLKAWYDSDDYKPLIDLRLAATTGNAFAVDGL